MCGECCIRIFHLYVFPNDCVFATRLHTSAMWTMISVNIGCFQNNMLYKFKLMYSRERDRSQMRLSDTVINMKELTIKSSRLQLFDVMLIQLRIIHLYQALSSNLFLRKLASTFRQINVRLAAHDVWISSPDTLMRQNQAHLHRLRWLRITDKDTTAYAKQIILYLTV